MKAVNWIVGSVVLMGVSFLTVNAEQKNLPSVPLFDGKTLEGWDIRGRAVWRVEDGVIVGGQDGDPTRAGLLISKQVYKDFELILDFKIDEHGKYNSGVYLRRPVGKQNGRVYQVNIGRGVAGEYTGLYLNDWLDKGDERDEVRKPLEWNSLRIRAIGSHIQVWLNSKRIVDYTDKNPESRLLEAGSIAFQTYGAEGHSGWVNFRNIRIVNLSK